MELTGKFVVIVGSSGAGKSTLIKHIQEVFPQLVFPRSCVTRAIREGETQGDPYYFLSKEEFKEHIEHDDFIEWAEFSGNYYGTLEKSITQHLERGETVIKELEVQGARILLEKLPREALVIVFIDAGDWDEYAEARIKARAPISEDEIEARKSRYEDEQTFKECADHVVKNKDGDLDLAKKAFEDIINSII